MQEVSFGWPFALREAIMPKGPFLPNEFDPTQFSTSAEKANFGNTLLHFLDTNCARELFTKKFYSRLSMTFGHIAHYDIGGFYSTWFTGDRHRLGFVQKLLHWPCHGDTHEPDGFRMEPFRLPSVQSSALKTAALRPAMRKLRPPEPVFVRIASERPAAFVFRELRYAVEQAYGPWVTAGEWWSRSLWKCEQWDLAARSQDGAMLCCCLVRDLLRDQWQMAALYD